MPLAIGRTARLVQPVLQGEILDTQYNKDALELEHLVEFMDKDGEVQRRWFLASQLEEVTE